MQAATWSLLRWGAAAAGTSRVRNRPKRKHFCNHSNPEVLRELLLGAQAAIFSPKPRTCSPPGTEASPHFLPLQNFHCGKEKETNKPTPPALFVSVRPNHIPAGGGRTWCQVSITAVKQSNGMRVEGARRSRDVFININELSSDLLTSQSTICIPRDKGSKRHKAGGRASNTTDYPAPHYSHLTNVNGPQLGSTSSSSCVFC